MCMFASFAFSSSNLAHILENLARTCDRVSVRFRSSGQGFGIWCQMVQPAYTILWCQIFVVGFKVVNLR